ncbi:hypothetical protein IFM89_010909 [Coptis chinensis]|uniref:Uncharacterized protein n=1 Tax=Coptis chinensis TaxID=261450 RepID=A0A835IMZ1_9MAGN|nr:hypothetical protein IFM89_010909 [Coptis chinensis]
MWLMHMMMQKFVIVGWKKLSILCLDDWHSDLPILSTSLLRFNVYDFGWERPIGLRSGSGNKFDGKMIVFPDVVKGNGVLLPLHLISQDPKPNSVPLELEQESANRSRPGAYPVVDIVEDENIEDRGLGLENLVDACYGVHEGVRGDVYGGATDQISDFEQPFVPEIDLGKKYAEYKSKAEEKLYPSCEGPVTTLSTVVELHDLKKQYGWSGNSVSALLSMLRTWLPKENTLP